MVGHKHPASAVLLPELVRHVLGFLSCTEARKNSVFLDESKLFSEDEHVARKTLVACSKVSHAWRDVALPYVYHTVAIYCDFGVLDSKETPYVWELRLVAPMEDCVVDVIQKLPRLRVLRLYNLRTDPEPHITLRVGSPRSLDRLEFSNSACDAVDGILAISSLFSYIGSLGLHGVNFIENDTSRPSLCLGFEALELNACVGIKEFQCLFRPALTPPATRLTTLALIGVSWYVRTDRAKFWRVVAPALVNLMLDPKSMRSPRSPDFLSVLDLSQCTLLTTLTLTFSQDVIPDSDHSEWVRATRILSRLVGHPSVRRVIIQITVCIPIKGYIAYEGQNRSIEDALLELRDRQLEVAIVDGGSDDDCVEPGYLAALFPRVFASA